MWKTIRAIAAPMTARSTRCCASPPMVAPTSSTIDSPRSVGHIAAIAGRSIGAIVCRQNFAIAIKAPVLPAETAQSAAPDLHRFDRLPHRRDAPPGAQRLARLVAHLDRDVGVKNARLGGQPGMTLQDGPDRALVTIEKKLDVGTAFEREGRGGQDDRRPVIAPHRVQRYANVACHSLVRPRPGALPGRRGAARQ